LVPKKQKANGYLAIWLFGLFRFLWAKTQKQPIDSYFDQLFGYLAIWLISLSENNKSKFRSYFCIIKCYLAIWLIDLCWTGILGYSYDPVSSQGRELGWPPPPDQVHHSQACRCLPEQVHHSQACRSSLNNFLGESSIENLH
jgi:hypothetical protein